MDASRRKLANTLLTRSLDLVEWDNGERFLNWELTFLPRDSIGRRVMHAGQAIAPLLARRLATSWVPGCERDPAVAQPA